MPLISVNADGSISVVKNKEEVVRYYDVEIARRIDAMLKLQAFGSDCEPVKNRIRQLNLEKKQKLLEVL